MQEDQNPTENQAADVQEALQNAIDRAFDLLEMDKIEELIKFYDKVEERIEWKTFLAPNGWALLRSGIGVYYYHKANYKKAITIFQDILSVIKSNEDAVTDDVKGTTYVNLATNYSEIGQLQKAIDHGMKAIPFFEAEIEEEGTRRKLFDTFFLIHNAYFELKQYKKSLEYNLRALELIEKYMPDNTRNKGVCLANTGIAHYKLRNYHDAVKYMELAIPLMSKHGLDLKGDIEDLKIDYLACIQQVFRRISPSEKGKYRNFIYEYIYDRGNAKAIDRLFS